jgi:hypothetical protein
MRRFTPTRLLLRLRGKNWEGRREKREGRRGKGEEGREKREGRRGKGEEGREKREGRRGKGEEGREKSVGVQRFVSRFTFFVSPR